MKVTNYKYGYIPQFSCSIHGKISMTREEWIKAYKYLRSPSVRRSFLPSYPWVNAQLVEDQKRGNAIKKGLDLLINIRVPMTEKLAEHYGLKIKRANYMIEITH